MQNENVRMATSKQLLELAAILGKNLPLDELDSELTQNWIENPRAIAKGLREMLIPPDRKMSPEKIAQMIADWTLFYREEFNLDCNFEFLSVPAHRPGFDRLLVIPQGLTLEGVFERCNEEFPADKISGLDLDMTFESTRDPNRDGTYAIWVRDRLEADKEYKYKSYALIKRLRIQSITLLERMIFGLKYFKELGVHLDQENTTLCAGSQDSYGEVPTIEHNDEMMCVSLAQPLEENAHLRIREVVSLLHSA